MDQYREMTPEEMKQFVAEYEAYQRWWKVKIFIQDLFSDQARKVWFDVNKGYVYAAKAYNKDGKKLEYDPVGSFWKKPSIYPGKTWQDILEGRYINACRMAAEANESQPTVQLVAHRVLTDRAFNIFHNVLHPFLRPGKNYDEDYEGLQDYDYDFDQIPKVSFPKVYIPAER